MLVSKLCDFWPQAVSSRFSNNQNHYFIDFWLGSWRLRGRKNVSVGHETSIPSFEKVSASSFSSRGLFFSSIWTVRPRYARSDNCPISEKKSPLSEKEVRPWASLSQGYLFPALQNNYSASLQYLALWYVLTAWNMKKKLYIVILRNVFSRYNTHSHCLGLQ